MTRNVGQVPFARAQLRLAGKVAVVTGGVRGIGRAIVEKCAAEGATVAFVDCDAEMGQQLARAGPRLDFYVADVTVEDDVRRAIEEVAGRHGTIDVLVNSAGVNAY